MRIVAFYKKPNKINNLRLLHKNNKKSHKKHIFFV